MSFASVAPHLINRLSVKPATLVKAFTFTCALILSSFAVAENATSTGADGAYGTPGNSFGPGGDGGDATNGGAATATADANAVLNTAEATGGVGGGAGHGADAKDTIHFMLTGGAACYPELCRIALEINSEPC